MRSFDLNQKGIEDLYFNGADIHIDLKKNCRSSGFFQIATYRGKN